MRVRGEATHMQDLEVGPGQVVGAQMGLLQLGGRDVVLPYKGHHQDVLLQHHHVRTRDLCFLHSV